MRTAKIVHIKQSPGNLSDKEPETVAVRALVNHLVRTYMKNGGRLKALAIRANMSVQTLSRLAYYETTRPQWETVIRVCKALDCLPELAKIFDRSK